MVIILHRLLRSIAQLWESLFGLRASRAEREQKVVPAFHALEPRRVLSVNAMFAAGVLDIAIQDDGGSTTATLMVDGDGNFFVDADGDQTYDDGSSGTAELQGLISELTKVNVVGEAGVGTFFWRDNFSAAMIHEAAGYAVNITDVQQVDLTATFAVDGDVNIATEAGVHFGGDQTISGSLSVSAALADSDVTNSADSRLVVTGNATFAAADILLGVATNDEIQFGSFTAQSSGDVVLAEDGAGTDPGTSIVGDNFAATFTVQADGTVAVASTASIATSGNLTLESSGVDADILIDGSVSVSSGDLTLHAEDRVVFGSNSATSATQFAHVLVTADGSGVHMFDGANIAAELGRVELNATAANATITLSSIASQSTLADAVQISAWGNILDNTSSEDINIAAANGSVALFSAHGNIGSFTDGIDIDGSGLSFHSGASGVVNLIDHAGGIRIDAESQSGGAVFLAANSPLVISADITVGASATFTAGNSAAAGDTITINNSAVVTLNSATNGLLQFNAGDDIVFDGGRIETTGGGAHIVRLSADLDHAGVGAGDGDRGSVTQDGNATIEVTAGELLVNAAGEIDLDTEVEILDAASTLVGDIRIQESTDILLRSITANNGSIDVLSGGSLIGLQVRAFGATADVHLTSMSGGVAFSATGSVVADRDVFINVVSGDMFLGSVVAATGDVRLEAGTGNIAVGFLFANNDVSVTSTLGSIFDLNDDAIVDVTAGGTVALHAATGIEALDSLGADTKLELSADSVVTASSAEGDIQLRGLGALVLTSVTTGNGAISVMADGRVEAIHVDASATDDDSNDVSIMNSAGDIEVQFVRAGLFLGDVSIAAFANIVDADGPGDDIDVEANDVTLIAHNGSIGGTSGDIFKGSFNALEVNTNAEEGDPANQGDLVATALGGAIVLNGTLAGTGALTSDAVVLQADGDLDVSSAVFTADSVALIADADGNGSGTLTLAPSLSVGGDLRIEGANIVASGGSINLNADRLLIASGDALTATVTTNYLDATSDGDLNLASLARVTLVDLNCDNVALQTLGSSSGIEFLASDQVVVADDVIAGNDGLSTSTGSISFAFQAGSNSDFLIHDTILTDHGDIDVVAPGSIRVELPAIVDPNDETGADNIAVVTSVEGNITLVADHDENGGEFFMSDDARVIAGRGSSVDYLPGIDGNASPSVIELGSSAMGLGQSQVVIAAGDAVTVGSVQSANATASAIIISSLRGGIVDGGDHLAEVVADFAGAQVTLTAELGIGNSDALETQVHRLHLQNGSEGNIAIEEIAAGGNLILVGATQASSTGNIVVGVSAGQLQVDGGVAGISGHITLAASDSLSLNAPVSTGGSGSIYFVAGTSLAIDGPVTTFSGDILASAGTDLSTAADLISTTGNVGLLASGDLNQSSNVTTGGDVLAAAGGLLTMSSSAVTSGGDTVLYTAGGDLELGLITAANVGLSSSANIVDHNGGDVLNVRATHLSLQSGGLVGNSDTLNAANSNAHALDLEVGTVAGVSASGIYLQELTAGGDLVVGSVTGLSVIVSTSQVHFNSTSDIVSEGGTAVEQSGLTTGDGPLKLAVRDGDLLVDSSITAGGSGDILLWASSDVIANASLSSDTGHITIAAGDSLSLNASTTTGGSGSIYFVAGTSLAIDGPVTTFSGDILASAGTDLSTTADLISTTGNVGLLASGDLNQSSNVTTGGDVLAAAGGLLTMSSSAVTSGGDTVLYTAGGDLELGLITAANVGLSSSANIVDHNGGDVLNVRATHLSLQSGGLVGNSDTLNAANSNAHALDLEVGTVAGVSASGIYLQELTAGGDLVVGSVTGLSVIVSTSQVHFNSTSDIVSEGGTAVEQSGLTTGDGPLKLAVRDGDLLVDSSITAGGSGDILLWASSDVIANASLSSDTGHITVAAGDSLSLNAPVSTGGSGSIYFVAGTSLAIDGPVTTFSGDILASAGTDLSTAADLNSTTGNVGLLASGDLNQSSNVTTGGDVLAAAGGLLTMSSSAVTSGGDTVLYTAGGDLELGLITAANVGLIAGANIVDHNGGDVLNVRAMNLSLQAGGLVGNSDTLNAANSNAHALDLEVGTVAGASASGIYLQELADGGDLVVGSVTGLSVIVSASQVQFNSTSDIFSEGASTAAQTGLTTNDGPLKLAVRDGDLLVDSSITAGGSGDILLWASSDVIANASLSSDTGHITVAAGEQIDLNAPVSTGGEGSIYFVAGTSLAIDGPVTTFSGDILASAGTDLSTTADLNSTTGNVGLLASGDLNQLSNVTTGGDVLSAAGGLLTMSSSAVTSGGDTVLYTAGGDLELGLITAANVGLIAGANIVDHNGGDVLNVRAAQLSLQAGGLVGNSDTSNAANSNAHALDLEVGTVAGASASGIYLQELADGGDLVVGSVTGLSVIVSASQVHFNSTSDIVSEGASSADQTGLTTNDGPLKLAVRDGDLLVDSSITAGGSGDILLWASSGVIANASLSSDTGHITVAAGDSLSLNAPVSTGGSGSIYFVAGTSLAIDGPVTTFSGDILASAGTDLSTAADLISTTGNVGLLASGDLNQSSNVTTGGDVLAAAGGLLTMSSSAVTSGGDTVLYTAGGDLELGLITAANVGLSSSANIVDHNGGDVLNVRATHLSLQAGGLVGNSDTLNAANSNAHALDLEVGTVAGASASGIYLQELADGGDLVVGSVSELSVIVSTSQVHFNSTSDIVSEGGTAVEQSGLTTGDGPLKLAVRDGDLLVDSSITAGGSGDILLWASSGVIANASLSSDTGHITVAAGDSLSLNAPVSTGGSGSIYFVAGTSLAIDGPVTTFSGDILASAGTDLSTAADLISTTGNVGLLASGDLNQSSNVTTGGDVLAAAGGLLTMSSSAVTSGGDTVLYTAGGDLELGLITAANVGLIAGANIVDHNGGDVLNVRATHLSLQSGGLVGNSDTLNAANSNAHALDLEVGTVAGAAASGIYLQELTAGGDLVVGSVTGLSVIVSTSQVHFNSTSDIVSEGVSTAAQAGLTTNDGPLKLAVRDGDLLVDSSITAGGSGDILLWASSDVIANASLSSDTGHITVAAGDSLSLNAPVSTGGSGSIYFVAGTSLAIDGPVTTVSGDILASAGTDLSTTADLISTTGNVGIEASSNIQHGARIATDGDVLIVAHRDVSMGVAGSVTAGQNLVVIAGASTPDAVLTMGHLVATHVSVDATGDVLDGNGSLTNATASWLRIVADSDGVGGGQIGLLTDSVETAAITLAARSEDGVYLHQQAVGRDLQIDDVEGIAVEVNVRQVNFNSTSIGVEANAALGALEDVETRNTLVAGQPAIRIEVDSGSLTIRDGSDFDGVGVRARDGSIELVTQNSGDIALQTGVVTGGMGANGTVLLVSAGWVDELASDANTGVSDARIVADQLRLQVAEFAHLHNVTVNQLEAVVVENGALDDPWQFTNAAANAKGDDFLEVLGTDRIEAAEANGVLVEYEPTAPESQRDTALRERYEATAEQFRFEDTYEGQYALFLRNTQSLEVETVVASGGNAPNVYIETLGASDLTVSREVGTRSAGAEEGGIVLVAGRNLQLDGLLTTQAELAPGVFRHQLINEIGRVEIVSDFGPQVAYLNAAAYDGGDGVPAGDNFLTSTQFVVRDQQLGLSALAEDYRTHVFQRVIMQFGYADESGFVSLVGYADGEVQQFDVAGEEGVRTKSTDQLDRQDQTAISAAPQTVPSAAAFSRAIAFDNMFLDANQMLPTVAIVRRAADFFLFENAAVENGEGIKDLTVEAFEVENVFALGSRGATELPSDPEPVQPPSINNPQPTPLIANPSQLVDAEIELEIPRERNVEVAIYRVFYDDENQNGQPDEQELPTSSEVLNAKISEDKEDEQGVVEIVDGERIKLEEVKTQAGGSPTVEDIEKLKNEYLDNPQQQSGAYAIIEKGIDDKETILDVFSVRDLPLQADDADGPLIQIPKANQPNDEDMPSEDSSESLEDLAPPPEPTDGKTGYWKPVANEAGATRLGQAGLVAGSLWLAAVVGNSSKSLLERAEDELGEESAEVEGFSRQARRSRFWKRKLAGKI